MSNILWAAFWFFAIGGVFGVLLAVASKIFAVKVDPKAMEIRDILPGANCGGCGFAGCDALAAAIAAGEAAPTSCTVCDAEANAKIAAVMGVEAGKTVRLRAQVMCSGTEEFAKKKYVYEGARDCVAAARLGGGDKLCPNGCIGLGTCVASCPFAAITVVDGVAVVDYGKCIGCGVCTRSCPKHIIKLVPFHATEWVGCMSVDNGKITRSYCDVGCISCKICERGCPEKAITVNDSVAAIDYEKCTGCGLCVSKCPRKIIWSSASQGEEGLIIKRGKITEPTDLK